MSPPSSGLVIISCLSPSLDVLLLNLLLWCSPSITLTVTSLVSVANPTTTTTTPLLPLAVASLVSAASSLFDKETNQIWPASRLSSLQSRGTHTLCLWCGGSCCLFLSSLLCLIFSLDSDKTMVADKVYLLQALHPHPRHQTAQYRLRLLLFSKLLRARPSSCVFPLLA